MQDLVSSADGGFHDGTGAFLARDSKDKSFAAVFRDRMHINRIHVKYQAGKIVAGQAGTRPRLREAIALGQGTCKLFR